VKQIHYLGLALVFAHLAFISSSVAATIAESLEITRNAVAAGEPEKAEAELQKIFDAGFSAVTVVTGDAVINTLAGREKYDALVASMTIAAYPCEHQEGFRDFDFWIGDWIVHGAKGTFAGNNSITIAEKGCLLLENWSSASGGTGMSINYLDKASNEWVQVWNDASGTQINIRGGLTDEGMLLVGQIHNVGNGKSAPFRGLWTPLEDGRVRQFFEQSNDGGKTWQTWFDGYYTRIDEAKDTN
jgi:hypothetical protein